MIPLSVFFGIGDKGQGRWCWKLVRLYSISCQQRIKIRCYRILDPNLRFS